MVESNHEVDTLAQVAIVGMAGRFPGAADVGRLWQNICQGTDSITRFTDEELTEAGVAPDVLADPRYVPAGAVLDGIDLFDAEFFGIAHREAQLLDPQQRLFLESAWAALEAAGCDPSRYAGSIGVFAGSALSTYLLHNLAGNEAVRGWASPMQVVLGNDKDSLATSTAYSLDLRGPAFNVQSYCSTSLVAVAAACSSLVAGECDVALAGGTAVSVPQRVGYLYQEGGISSPDGRCRAFDVDAQGAPLGSGVGVVVLKRLEDALADGDHVHAVIRGWAVNNDGALKVGYTAPGVRGQSSVIAEALANADIDPATVDLIEAHGTGTALGDAAEIAALRKAFDGVERPGGTALGSVKTNIGHLDRAAGVTGLIKATLALEHRVIPPTVNFRSPNPQLAQADSPFRVPTSLEEWPRREHPRRAGVSAFGIGGTNAHVVLEQAPAPSGAASAPSTPAHRRPRLLLLSARTDAAADTRVADLADHVRARPDLALGDVAYTLQVGRREFEHRRACVVHDGPDALAALTEHRSQRVLRSADPAPGRTVGLVLAGVGEQYAGMAAGLYATEPVFAATVDTCATVLEPLLGRDIRTRLFGDQEQHRPDARRDLAALLGRTTADQPADELTATTLAQPGVFVVEYAVAKLLESWGIRPDALLGYSLGEYVAAALAGVLSLPDALRLVAHRALMIDRLPQGAMTAVSSSADDLASLLPPDVDIAVVNAPTMCVLAGPGEPMAAVEAELASRGVAARRLDTAHAFHSEMLRPAAAELTAWVAANVTLSAPQVPYLSNVTGTWIRPEEAQDPAYWADHMCGRVRFADAVGELLSDPARVVVEIGPGQSLSSLVRAHPRCDADRMGRVVATLPGRFDATDDVVTLHTALGRLWLAGVSVDWSAYHDQDQRRPRRVPLPTYPFQRQSYWIDPPESLPAGAGTNPLAEVQADAGGAQDSDGDGDGGTATAPRDVGAWLHEPHWEPAEAVVAEPAIGPFLVLADPSNRGGDLGGELSRTLSARGLCVTAVPGEEYAELADDLFSVRPDETDDYARLLSTLAERGCVPASIGHLWGVGDRASRRDGYHSVTSLARGLSAALPRATVHLLVVTDGVQMVDGSESLVPEKAAVLGPCLVLPQEYPNLSCTSVDLGSNAGPEVVPLLERELAGSGATAVAIRGGRRLVQSFRQLTPGASAGDPGVPALREGGTYLLTGGLGNVGLRVARHIARSVRQPRLVLTGRHGLPARAEWERLLAETPSGAEQMRTVHRIEQVLALEELGAQVLVVAADATDADQMAGVVSAARAWAGAVHGVVHGAGLTETRGFLPVADMAQTVAEEHFVAKADSFLALERALGEDPVDFCLLQSSMAAVLGGLGFSAYAGANAVLDAAAARARRTGRPWVSVNWDTWRTEDAPASTGLGASMSAHSMTVEEGLAALDRVLSSGAGRVVVSVGDLSDRLRQWVGREVASAEVPLAAGRFPRPDLPVTFVAPRSALERRLAELWCDALGLERVGLNDNFFDLGGNSLIGLQLVRRVGEEHGTTLPAVVLFEAPTIGALARHLVADGPAPAPAEAVADRVREDSGRPAPVPAPSEPPWCDSADRDIAVIGMAGRFPGAGDVEAFWQNLRDGVESISFFTDRELLESGVDPETLSGPDYVKARPVLDGVEEFDAAFFGYSPREAELTDPQQRLFLECSWHALESAGYAPRSSPGAVGVFGGTNISTYLHQLYASGDLDGDVSDYQAVIGNDKDALTTTVSYRLDLTGPSLAVQTFCSTSLVAVHLAVRSLRGGECDLALAGGVSVRVPDRVGHRYTPGGMESPDGHVRPFDASSRGSMFGDGVGVVVLKRLADALTDGDTVHAVIKGSAVNNDGSLKVGFTAPSVSGQSAVVTEALRDARVAPETISYVEAHGTGTPLGDPIEVASLTRAFGSRPERGSCPIGSVKSNVGHLDRAAGVSGLIKTVLSLKHAEIPATLHFESPNPEIDFEGSPFYVNARLAPWQVRPERLRRAGVNSLGMGGTNVHVVVEEAPTAPPTTVGREVQVVPVSARSRPALAKAAANLSAYLRGHPDIDVADLAFTLQVGREEFDHRFAIACSDVAGLVEALDGGGPVGDAHHVEAAEPWVRVHLREHEPRTEVLRRLRELEPEFAVAWEECEAAWAAARPGRHPDRDAAVFAGLSATVRLLRSWGVPVEAVTGEGIGAYAAAAAVGSVPVTEAVRAMLCGDVAPAASARGVDGGVTLEIGPGTAVTPDAREDARPLDGAGFLHDALASLWLHGVPVDWSRYHAGERRRRIPLPGYPFQRERFWVDRAVSPGRRADVAPTARGCAVSNTSVRRPTLPTGDPRALLSALPRRPVDDWFYLPGWRQVAPPLPAASPAEGGWVVFADERGVGDRILSRLATLGASTVRVGVGERFSRTPDGGYVVRPERAADIARLVEELSLTPGSMRRLVHTWTLDDPADPQSAAGFMRERGYSNLVWLAQALGGTPGPHDLVVVSTATQDVTGLDEVDPDRSVVTGPCRVIPLELGGLSSRQVDVGATRDAEAVAAAAEQVLHECLADPGEPMVAWRAGRRWVPDYQPLPLPPLDGDLRPLRENGVYLVTGGLGGVGLSIARGLARTVSARLVLMTRSGAPPREEWPALLAHPETAPSVRDRIQAVLELERLGSEVLVCAADVTDAAGVEAALGAASARFGALHGVVHAAGVPGMGLMQFKTPDSLFDAMAPKVEGTRVLHEQLSARPLDFLVLFSSITAITGGGPGQADYCSANAYLDAFASAANQARAQATRVTSIGWGEWQWNAWSQGLAGYAPEARAFFEENRRRFGISPDEGWQAFLRALRSGQRHVVVSTQDFAEIVRLSPRFSVATVLELGSGRRAKHPRPELGTPFVAPATETEAVIADLWAEALGLADVGIHDNFFELGGNSLLGVDLVARLCARLGRPALPPHVLYLAPSVHELAAVASGTEAHAWVDDRRDRGAMRREGMRRRRSA